MKNLMTVVEREMILEKELEETWATQAKEAAKHFNTTKQFRAGFEGDFDERFLYTENELKLFLSLCKNPKVKIEVVYDDIDIKKIFCYKLYR